MLPRLDALQLATDAPKRGRDDTAPRELRGFWERALLWPEALSDAERDALPPVYTTELALVIPGDTPGRADVRADVRVNLTVNYKDDEPKSITMRGEKLSLVSRGMKPPELCLQFDIDLARGTGKLEYLFAAQVPGNCEAWKVGEADRAGVGRAVLEMMVSLMDELVDEQVVMTLDDGSMFNAATAPLLRHGMTEYLRMRRGYSFYEGNGFVTTPKGWQNEDTQILLQEYIDWANLIFGTPLNELRSEVDKHYRRASTGLRRRAMKAVYVLTGPVEDRDDTESDSNSVDRNAIMDEPVEDRDGTESDSGSVDWDAIWDEPVEDRDGTESDSSSVDWDAIWHGDGDWDEEDSKQKALRFFNDYGGKSVRQLMVLLEEGLEKLDKRPEATPGGGPISADALRAEWANRLRAERGLEETVEIYDYLDNLRMAKLTKNDPDVGVSNRMTKVLRPLVGGRHEEVYVDAGEAKRRVVPKRKYKLEGMTASVDGVANLVRNKFFKGTSAIIQTRD